MSHLDFFFIFDSFFPQETEKGVESRGKSVNCIGILEMTSPVAWKTCSKKVRARNEKWQDSDKTVTATGITVNKIPPYWSAIWTSQQKRKGNLLPSISTTVDSTSQHQRFCQCSVWILLLLVLYHGSYLPPLVVPWVLPFCPQYKKSLNIYGCPEPHLSHAVHI